MFKILLLVSFSIFDLLMRLARKEVPVPNKFPLGTLAAEQLEVVILQLFSRFPDALQLVGALPSFICCAPIFMRIRDIPE